MEHSTVYAYDNQNRVICELNSDGSSVEYEYDKLGRVVKKTVKTIDPHIDIHFGLPSNELVLPIKVSSKGAF